MNQSTLRRLDYSEVLRRLSVHCHFSVAMERAREQVPATSLPAVRQLLEVTAEAVDLVSNFPDVSVGGARDIRELLAKADKGGRLQPGELLLVGDTLRAARELRGFFRRLPDAEERFPHLFDESHHLGAFPGLETDIGRTVGPRGDVLDTASEELGRIRRAVRVAYSRLMDRLNNLISGGRFGSALQENIITIRGGRYVIPVRADARGVVRGIVHDTSASGQTLFVEPFDVVELNNRWREQQAAEEREIERILDVLSQKVGAEADELFLMVDTVAEIDLAMAKARLSFSMRAQRPTLHDPANHAKSAGTTGHPRMSIRLERARHPLLDQATVVPIDIEIGDRFRALLITGPNTGGKTVALKTVGLLTLMAQTGMFLPAESSSVVSVFPSLFIDVGDEQSIEQSLSTFSAHLRTITAMLAEVESDSLVLLDELGAGTDPQEGSALARAIIESLLERGPIVIATTHYPEVKAFAYATPGVENASVEFDLESLAPTYRLMVGVPGRSNALAIARRLGMPADIVASASGLLTPDDERADALIEDIRRRREEVDRELAQARETNEDARELRRRASRSLREAEETRRTAREQAVAEAERELAEAREALRGLERARVSVAPNLRAQVVDQRGELNQAEEAVRAFRRDRLPTPVPTEIQRQIVVGDRVHVPSLDQEGEVVSIDGDEAEIQMGALKVRQPLGSLRRLGGRGGTADSQATSPPKISVGHVPIEIDIRGNRAAEVQDILEGYLQDAYLAHLPWVRIIHGKGTGALRQVVREHLRSSPVVARSQTASIEEGGDGATLAYLRDA